MAIDYAALGVAGVGLAGTLGAGAQSKKNRKFQEEQNTKDRQWQYLMYQMERKNAVKDWETQNAYNSPEEQMNRLRQAGLNPNLVYGKGADNTAAMIANVKGDSPNQTAPQVNPNLYDRIGDNLGSYFRNSQQNAQVDQLHEQIVLLQKQQNLTEAQTLKTVSEADLGKFDLGLKQEIRDNLVTSYRLDNQKKEADIAFTVNQDQRNALKNTSDIRKTVSDIALQNKQALNIQANTAKTQDEREKLQAEIRTLDKALLVLNDEAKVKQAEARLAEKNIFKGDNIYFRELIQALINLASGEGGKAKGNFRFYPDKNPKY